MNFTTLFIKALTIYLLAFICTSCEDKNSKTETDTEKSHLELNFEKFELPTASHIRGMHLCEDKSIWISGTENTILKSTDEGQNWIKVPVEDTVHMDFRSITAIDSDTALVVSAGYPARVFRTSDGGKNWKIVYADKRKEAFYDGIIMNKRGEAWIFGDPIDGHFQLKYSKDFGRSWNPHPIESRLSGEVGEGAYAASNTVIRFVENGIAFATGGAGISRIFFVSDTSLRIDTLPIGGSSGCGIFGMAVHNQRIAAVGGCYMQENMDSSNIVLSSNGGVDWEIPQNKPGGYRSCADYSENGIYLAVCGRNGAEISTDNGNSWQLFSTDGYYTCRWSGKRLYLAGKSGKAAVLKITPSRIK